MRQSGMRTRLLLVPALLSATLLAACGDDGDDTAAPPATPSSPSASATSSAPAAPSPSPAESDAPGGGGPEFGTAPQTSPAGRSDKGLTLVDVRVGAHEGYDRVVFEVAGDGVVGWTVQYEDDPRTEGEGAPVELDGDATLAVLLDGMGYPFETGVEPYETPSRFAPGLSSVREVQVGGVFEGRSDSFVGVAAERPFRVFRLEQPQRVVVDIAYGD